MKMTGPTDSLARFLNQPLTVGTRQVAGRLFLAPMTGLGHVAFRELAAGFGGFGLLFSEMCNARLVPTENPRLSRVFRWREAELPHLACQLVGSDPGQMAEAAQRVEAEGFFGVDLNFGCAAAAVCKRRSGAALLETPDLAVRIVAAVRQATSLPLSVKFRTPRSPGGTGLETLARALEGAGADWLILHPRIAPDRRSRPPRWEDIGRVKQAVSIPVIGNGNVFDREDCRTMLAATGCDGVALGRMAIARPWIFAAWTRGVTPAPGIHPQTALTLARLLEHHFDPNTALRYFKRWITYFAANFQFGHCLYKSVAGAKALDEIPGRIERFFETRPEISPRPNLNLFMQV